MKKNTIIFSVLIITLSILGYIYFAIKKTINFKYEISNFKFEEIKLKTLKGNFNFKIYNPTPIDFTITELKLKLSINNVFMTDLNLSENTLIKSMDSVLIPIHFETNPKKILSINSIKGIFSTKAKLIGYRGNIKVKKGIFTFKYPVDIVETLNEYI